MGVVAVELLARDLTLCELQKAPCSLSSSVAVEQLAPFQTPHTQEEDEAHFHFEVDIHNGLSLLNPADQFSVNC